MKSLPQLGRRELEIMNVVWDLGEATVRTVWETLDSGAYTTVLTMMRSLDQNKQVLEHRREGKAYVYHATVRREVYVHWMAADLCDTACGGSIPSLVNSLLGRGKPSREDLIALKKIIAEQERKESGE